MVLNKRTPCVGICSTTFGDLVCRGCKRFAHEITQWNGYAEEQQAHVWRRLNTLRDGVVGHYLRICNPQDFNAVSSVAGFADLETPEQMYAVLGFLVAKDWPLEKAGMESLVSKQRNEPGDMRATAVIEQANTVQTPLAVMQKIDAEIYTRSLAHYERNFKVLV